jgi:hypothetical protein
MDNDFGVKADQAFKGLIDLRRNIYVLLPAARCIQDTLTLLRLVDPDLIDIVAEVDKLLCELRVHLGCLNNFFPPFLDQKKFNSDKKPHNWLIHQLFNSEEILFTNKMGNNKLDIIKNEEKVINEYMQKSLKSSVRLKRVEENINNNFSLKSNSANNRRARAFKIQWNFVPYIKLSNARYLATLFLKKFGYLFENPKLTALGTILIIKPYAFNNVPLLSITVAICGNKQINLTDKTLEAFSEIWGSINPFFSIIAGDEIHKKSFIDHIIPGSDENVFESKLDMTLVQRIPKDRDQFNKFWADNFD